MAEEFIRFGGGGASGAVLRPVEDVEDGFGFRGEVAPERSRVGHELLIVLPGHPVEFEEQQRGVTAVPDGRSRTAGLPGPAAEQQKEHLAPEPLDEPHGPEQK